MGLCFSWVGLGMRWLCLLLLMLNVFYGVWYQQEAPLRPKEVPGLSMSRAARQDIQLLSESPMTANPQCLFVGGEFTVDEAKAVEQRLVSLDIQADVERGGVGSGGFHWLKIAESSRRLVDDDVLGRLAQDFPQIKSKIMSCEGIATAQ